MRQTRDLDLGEECAQDAFATAVTAWANDGIPANPGAWLTTVARRRAIDVIRREQLFRRTMPLLVEDDVVDTRPADPTVITDDRLRLIFVCAHPALAMEARVALTLRLLCGLTTAEVARAFLVSEPTMAARITRAKKKIANARIPYRMPSTADLPERIEGVLAVVHLLFTTGHSAPSGSELVRVDLVDRSLDLARLLRGVFPDDAEVAGLLGLILLTDARKATRVDADGRLLLLADQDRSQWDEQRIAEGLQLTRLAMSTTPGKYGLQAALAAEHASAPSYEQTDWLAIAAIYDQLMTRWPTPIVALNRAVARGLGSDSATGLAELEALRDDPVLSTYSYTASARANFLRQLNRIDEAIVAYEEALLLTTNEIEQRFLADRIDELRQQS